MFALALSFIVSTSVVLTRYTGNRVGVVNEDLSYTVQRGRYVRSLQSCSPTTDTSYSNSNSVDVWGFTWDGQFCQPCNNARVTGINNDLCHCKEYRGCDKCQSTSTLVTGYETANLTAAGSDNVLNACAPCPGHATTNYFDSMSTYKYGGASGEVKTCTIPKTMIGKVNRSNIQSWMTGFLASECAANVEGSQTYRLYGSVCWSLTGCEKYNKWGRCATCMAGYFLTEKQTCSSCRGSIGQLDISQSFHGYDFEYCESGSGASSCIDCNNGKQCNKCSPGYYLASPVTFQNHTSIPSESDDAYQYVSLYTRSQQTFGLLDDSNYCAPCPAGCSCELNAGSNGIPKGQYGTNEFWNLKPLSNAYYMVINNRDLNQCTSCRNQYLKSKIGVEQDTMQQCIQCTTSGNIELPDEEGAPFQVICEKCVEYEYQSSKDYRTYYYKDPIAQPNESTAKHYPKYCIACPAFCYSCDYIADSDGNMATSCVSGKCFNGYRESTNQKITTCVQCQGEGVSRCESAQDGSEIPSQCQTKSTAGQNNDYLIPEQNINVPNQEDYQLIRQDVQGQPPTKCVKNTYRCRNQDPKPLNPDDENKIYQCATCYYDLGYEINKIIVNNLVLQTCKLRCQNNGETINGCIDCVQQARDDKTTYYTCQTCSTNYYLSVNTVTNINTCTSCNNEITNCKTCSSGSVCTKCYDRYRLQKEGTECQQCNVQNCLTCNRNIDQCDVCDTGFILWPGQIHKAGQYTVLDTKNNVCETCEFGCLTCGGVNYKGIASRKECTQCQSGYYLYSGTCHPMQDECLQWQTVQGEENPQVFQCLACKYGYRITSGSENDDLFESTCMRCFSPQQGTIHCPYDKGSKISGYNWYSTVNDLNLNKADNPDQVVSL